MPDKDKFKEFFTSDLAHADVFNEKCYVPGEENRKKLDQHVADETNPHEVTWSQTGASPSPHGNAHHDPAFAQCPHGNECHDPDFLPASQAYVHPPTVQCNAITEQYVHPPTVQCDALTNATDTEIIIHGNQWHNPDFRAIQPTSISLRVGSTRDYTTLNAALAAASKFYPLYVRGGLDVNIVLDADYVETQGVYLRGIDLSYVSITSVGNATIIANVGGHLFQADYGARLPRIGCKFNMAGNGWDGLNVRNTSTAIIYEGGGILNAGQNGVTAWSGSSVRINGGIVTGAQANLRVGLAMCAASDATLTGGVVRGVLANRGKVSIVNSNCRRGAGDSTSDIYLINGSIVNAADSMGGCNISFNTLSNNGICFK